MLAHFGPSSIPFMQFPSHTTLKARRQSSKVKILIPRRPKVAVVAGAESGLGYESTKFLLRNGVTVYAICRDPCKGGKAIKLLSNFRYKGRAIFIQGDVGNLASIEKAASEILMREEQIHIVVADLGWTCSESVNLKALSNHRSGSIDLYHLLNMLKPALMNTAFVSKPDEVRIVFISSSGFFTALNNTVIQGWYVGHVSEVVGHQRSIEARTTEQELQSGSYATSVVHSLRLAGVLVTYFHVASLRSQLGGYLPLYHRVMLNKLLWPVYFGTRDSVDNQLAKTERCLEDPTESLKPQITTLDYNTDLTSYAFT